MSWDNKKDTELRSALEGSGGGFVGRPVGVTGVLARLFRSTIHDLGINGGRWGNLMEAYLKTELKIIDKKRRERAVAGQTAELFDEEPGEINRRDRTSIRGNLNKEFKRKIMTWKVFCKGMRFLQIRRFKIIILAQQYNGVITQHSTLVSFEDVTHEISSPDDPSQGGEAGDIIGSNFDILTQPDDVIFAHMAAQMASKNFDKV